MGTVTCETCRLEYDDTFRLTYCPHESFEMNCVICRGGRTFVAHSIKELEDLLAYRGTVHDN